MAKVKVTIEIDERFFAWESTGDLLKYSADFVDDSIYLGKPYNDLVNDSASCAKAGHVKVTGAQLVKEGIWKDYYPED